MVMYHSVATKCLLNTFFVGSLFVSYVSIFQFFKCFMNVLILVDCKLGIWSAWSTCEAGTRMRTRNEEIKPANGGLECGDLKEKEDCNEPGNDFNQFLVFL